jgi:hypothetical protein
MIACSNARACAAPPPTGSMLRFFASTNDAFPWMYVIFRIFETWPRPLVSLVTTLSLKLRSFPR